jgi:hypothetical protein
MAVPAFPSSCPVRGRLLPARASSSGGASAPREVDSTAAIGRADARVLVVDPTRADEAEEISGRTNIPVVVFPDGTHQVEPRNEETAAKLEELGLV